MQKITDIKEVNSLISSSLKAGVMTNCTITPDKWHEEIKNGSLYAQSFDGGVLFFRERTYGYQMSYYIYNEKGLTDISADKHIYTETVIRPKDTLKSVEILQSFGFKQLFTRIRMKSGATEKQDFTQTEQTKPEDAYNLLLRCFDEKTACLPTLSQLEKAESDGLIISRKNENGMLTGLIHAEAQRKKAELRHLAVAESQRGKGIAIDLVKEFNTRFADYQKFVWVREDYEVPKHIYEKLGFEPDGFKSIVMCK